MAYEKNVKIESNIEKDIITETFNKDDITHILSTLIDNAIKHTEEKKKVIVEFRKTKEKIIINVKNKGKEIPVSEREKIFDRFYRIDKSRNRNEKRYGLGLSIAKATVIKNKGSIQVDYKDGFTIFTVELPL
jgi:signal transduction histidine kinase